MKSHTTIGMWVKNVRKEHKYNQEVFAGKVLGISKRQLIRIEKDESLLNVVQLNNIVNYFNIEANEVLNLITNGNSINELIQKLYNLANSAEIDDDNLAILYDQLDELKHCQNDYQSKTIEMLQTFIYSKEKMDKSYIRYFFDKNIDFISENKRSINLLILTLDCRGLLRLEQNIEAKISKHVSIHKAHTIAAIYSNIIGELLKQGFRSLEIVPIFEKFKKHIIVSNEAIYLLLYHRHKLQYFLLIGDEKNTAKFKSIILDLLPFYDEKVNNAIMAELHASLLQEK